MNKTRYIIDGAITFLVTIISLIVLNRFNYEMFEYSDCLIALCTISLTAITLSIYSLKGTIKSEIGIIITVLITYIILHIIKREPDILVTTGASIVIISAILKVVLKFIETLKDIKLITFNSIIVSTFLSGTVLVISSAYVSILNTPINEHLAIISLAVVSQCISTIEMSKVNKLKALIIATVACTVYIGIRYPISDSIVLKDYYSKGYSTLINFYKYGNQKGNLYTVSQELGEDVVHLTDDNISYKNLSQISEDFTYSLYETQNEFIVFNWDTKKVIERKNKTEIEDKAKGVINKYNLGEIKDLSTQDGIINIRLTDGMVASLYIAPNEKGISLQMTAKDINKFGINYKE